MDKMLTDEHCVGDGESVWPKVFRCIDVMKMTVASRFHGVSESGVKELGGQDGPILAA